MKNAVLYWLMFVAGLIGTKILIVLLADRLKPYLTQTHIQLINKILAGALIFFGIKLLF